MCVCLSRKLLPWNNRLRRTSSPTTFSPSRWWPRFVPFTRRSFCPWMIQLSSSCRSPFQGLWQCGFVPHLQLFPSSPWRGDSSSVESACSATRDLFLFKPHLKASSSTTPSRRSPCSSSRSREALLDNFLDYLLRSNLLPLSDYRLARRAISASRRSPPQPPTSGRL